LADARKEGCRKPCRNRRGEIMRQEPSRIESGEARSQMQEGAKSQRPCINKRFKESSKKTKTEISFLPRSWKSFEGGGNQRHVQDTDSPVSLQNTIMAPILFF
jgi:hypothetical protein